MSLLEPRRRTGKGDEIIGIKVPLEILLIKAGS